ncbi:hypothetical protein AABB24_038456 [Solanum stoloniferum]
MERWWFNSMLFKKEFERRCGLNKSMGSLGPIENTSEDPNLKMKNIHSCSNVDYLFGVKDIWNFISDDTFLVSDRNGDSYSIYLVYGSIYIKMDQDTTHIQ